MRFPEGAGQLLATFRAGRETWLSMWASFTISAVAILLFLGYIAREDVAPRWMLTSMGSCLGIGWMAAILFSITRRLLYRLRIYQGDGFTVEESVLFSRRHRFGGAGEIGMIVPSEEDAFIRVLAKRKNRFFGDHAEFGSMMGKENIRKMIALVEDASDKGQVAR
ncbi:MAG: hypothetical protein EOP88_12265 [Verrucomicrobiaceae bacterium]|nr:MAG: hypothetical protein EOP88_12265 [Verrucomicrobiaceae bacterium]